MLNGKTPGAWRKGYALHRRRWKTDRYGEAVSVYDMDHPDAVVEDGSPDAVCWQDLGGIRDSGRLTSGAELSEQGERYREILQGALFSELELSVYDRVVVNGGVYELRKIQQWPGHRMLFLQRLW